MGRVLLWSLLFVAILGCVTLTPITGGPIRKNAHWQSNRFPIDLVILDGVENCRASKAKEAALRWNAELAKAGAPLAAFDIRTASAIDRTLKGYLWVTEDVLPKPQDPTKNQTIANCRVGYYAKSSKIWAAIITLGKERCSRRAAMHEMGHALGLRHAPDNCEGCIMNALVPQFEGKLVDHGWLRPQELQYVIDQMTR